MSTRKFKEQTCTSKVEEAMAAVDDFVTLHSLMAHTGCSVNQVSAALIHLRNHKAAAAMEADGKLWWYATPDTDTRLCKVEERTPEGKPRNRKPKKLCK